MKEVGEIISFFEAYASEFQPESGGGRLLEVPPFDLMPRDFLDFAERDLENETSIHSLVNATSNLKRAIDCQLDYFLKLVNLDSFYRKKRLGLNRKLGFLGKSGIFQSRSLEKLNNFRNRLEHHYEIPNFEDVEVYYDLVVAFVSVIEAAIPLVGYQSEINMILESGGKVYTKYYREEPKILIVLSHDETSFEEEYECTVRGSNPGEQLNKFSFFFKVHLLLRQYYDGIISQKHLIRTLKKNNLPLNQCDLASP